MIEAGVASVENPHEKTRKAIFATTRQTGDALKKARKDAKPDILETVNALLQTTIGINTAESFQRINRNAVETNAPSINLLGYPMQASSSLSTNIAASASRPLDSSPIRAEVDDSATIRDFFEWKISYQSSSEEKER
jgi:hypothetical protein